MRPIIYLVLPAYNEVTTLPPLLPKIEAAFASQELAAQLVIVDDGSTDGTDQIVLNYQGDLQIHFIQHPVNKGLGQALRSGFDFVLERANPEDMLATMDADNSQNPAQLSQMLEQMQAGRDLVIASRYRKGSIVKGVNGLRRLMSRGASYLFQLFIGIKGVRDYTCGYRLYKVSLLRQAADYYQDRWIEHDGFACMVECLVKMKRFAPSCAEIPLVLRYDLKSSESKMDVLYTIRQTFKVLFSRRK